MKTSDTSNCWISFSRSWLYSKISTLVQILSNSRIWSAVGFSLERVTTKQSATSRNWQNHGKNTVFFPKLPGPHSNGPNLPIRHLWIVYQIPAFDLTWQYLCHRHLPLPLPPPLPLTYRWYQRGSLSFIVSVVWNHLWQLDLGLQFHR